LGNAGQDAGRETSGSFEAALDFGGFVERLSSSTSFNALCEMTCWHMGMIDLPICHELPVRFTADQD
jgi:hypothetical protein